MPPRSSYRLVLAAAVLCYAALGAILRILPDYVHGHVGAGSAALGLAVGAPAITAVAARPVGGMLADRRGPRPLVLGGAVVMAAGALPALASGLGPLVASRLVVGAGEGAMMSATVLWLLRLAGPERRGRALGHIGLANYAGLALGPLVADALGGAGHAGRVLAASAALPLVGAGVAAALPAPPPAPPARDAAPRARGLVAATLRPGVGLMLVNAGYVALLAFGTAAAAGNGVAAAGVVVPLFAAAVIAVRLLGAGLPDRHGALRTVRVAVAAEAAGLVAVALAHGSAALVAAVVVLAAGQALAVPSLGLLALAQVAPERHGAAAGVFFAWFDAGVGLGGPLTGLAARAAEPAGALVIAAVAVAAVIPVARTPGGRVAPAGRRRRRALLARE